MPLDPVADPTTHEMGYDRANRLVQRDDDLFAYDGDGNLLVGTIGGASRDLVYDELNQLVQLDDEVYRYDADGLRVEIQRGEESEWTRYLYDPTSETPRVLVEFRSENQGQNWQVKWYYVHGVGLISRYGSPIGPSPKRVYHYDLRGSTVALSNPEAPDPITERYAYDPYGRIVDRTGEDTGNPFTYNGRDGVVDDGTGLYFMRTRYYAPELMRFIQKDQEFSGTLDDPQSLNRYAYVKGDPIRFVDPNGDKWDWGDTVALLGTIVTVAAVVALVAASGGTAAAAAGTFLGMTAAQWGTATTIAGALVTVGGDAVQVVSEREEQKQEKREKLETQREQLARADWSLDDLRKQIDDPNASWNRGLSVPNPEPASTDASDRPVPCRAGGAS